MKQFFFFFEISSQSEVVPKHPNGPDEVPFRTAVQKSADHFLMTIDGKPKEFGESNYGDIKNIFKNIQKSGYFDKAAAPPPVPEEPVCVPEPTVTTNDVEAQPLEQDTATETEIVPQERKDFHEAPAAANLPAPTFPPQQQQQPHLMPTQTPQIVQQVNLVQSIGPLVGMPRVNAAPIPTTGQIHQHLVDVQAVEQGYFKSQYIRPIADVIGPGQGNFFFLQDSELDSPEVLPGNYPQHPPQPQQQQPQQQPPQQQPPPPNSQISPSQPITHQIPTQPPGVAQPSQPQQQQQQQILPPTQLTTQQTFNNQPFQNIVPPQMYTKPMADHIPGFAPPVPMSLVVPNHQQKEQQSSQINTNQSQIHSNNSAPISFQSTNQQTMPKAQRHRAKDPKQMKNDQRVPEITEWKPEDAAKPPEEITEWRDQYTAVTDWNEETNEDSTWSNNNRYQYRNNGSGGGGSRDRNNRTRPGGNPANGGYRNRQINNYQSNGGGGRQSGGGNGERGGNGNSFYRNDNFYSNGNYNKQDGGYRGGDNKQDGGFKGGNFRSRDSREQVNGSSMRPGGGPRNVRNGDSAERDRGSNRNTAQNPRPTNKGGNSYGSAATRTSTGGNSTRPQSAVNA